MFWDTTPLDLLDMVQIIRCHPPEHIRFHSRNPEKLELAVFSPKFYESLSSLQKKNPVVVYVILILKHMIPVIYKASFNSQ